MNLNLISNTQPPVPISSQKKSEIVSLLEYVPHSKIIELKEKLLKYKMLDEKEW